MKKPFLPALAVLLLICACGCAEKPGASKTKTDAESISETQTTAYYFVANPLPDADLGEREADMDLTILDTQMAYVQLSNMMLYPEEFIGKTVKLRGKFGHAEEENKEFFVCYLMDSTACCSQSLEFETDEKYDYPESYPEEQSEITVFGIFDTYEYNGYTMYRLCHAEVDYNP